MKRWAVVFGLLCLAAWSLGASCNPPPQPDPCVGKTCPVGQHCEGGQCVDDPAPPCPDLGVPWCHETVPPMTCGACRHQPPGEKCPILAPKCPEPEPEPKCDTASGQNCGCYAWMEITGDWRLMSCTAPNTCQDFVCKPPAPPQTGCSIDGEPGDAIPGYVPALGTQVNQAMLTLHPECSIGGRCVLEEGRQEWQALVIAKLKTTWSLCAGQHNRGTDEIAVATSSTTPREGWHVYAGPEQGPGTIVWSPQAARGAYAAPEDPQPLGCTAPLPDTTPGTWRFGCNANGHPWVDCTPVVIGCAYCTAIGMGDGGSRCTCPTRSECPGFKCEERVACEKYVTGGTVLDSRNGAACEFRGDNPMQFWPQSGNCRLCNADKSVCSEWW